MAQAALSPRSVVRLPRHVLLRHDKVRGRWVLLAPERVLVPDDIAVAVLQRLDGARTLREVADALAADFAAPPELILNDVIALLQGLADKNFLMATEVTTHE